MWEQLRRFSKLDGPARGAFLRASAVLPFVSASLHFRGFRRTHAGLQKRVSSVEAASSPQRMGVALLTARMVRAAARYGFGHSTCLEESLALWFLLGRQGIASEFRIGVRKSGERFEAHAWVEFEGVALNEPEAMHEHYAAFDAALASMPQGPA